MKTILLTFSLLFTVAVHAQDKSDVFKRDAKITWLGLDFSAAKLIGDRERLGSESDIRRLINSWNEVIIKEVDKYDIAVAIDKPKIENATEITAEQNEQLDVLSLYSDNQLDYLHIKPSIIEEIVASYDYKGRSGIGLMFIVEGFNKLSEEASAWVTFINMDTKAVYFTERITGEPGGAGLRNYWANAIYDMLKKMKKKEFEMWRKKHHRP